MFPIMLPTPPVARSVELSDVVLSLKLLLVLVLVLLLDDIMKLKRRLLVDDDLEEEDSVRTAPGAGVLLFLT